MKTSFTSAPAVSGPSGVVTELFARLALITAGGLLLAAIIFYTVPRPRLSAWRGDGPKTVATVGFNDQINVWEGWEKRIENPQEVMQLKLFDRATRQVYPMRDDVYLRGTAVAWYSHNHWRRALPPPNSSPPGVECSSTFGSKRCDWRTAALTAPYWPAIRRFRIGPPVVQNDLPWNRIWIATNLFYIWPLIDPIEQQQYYLFDPHSGVDQRNPA